jgi:hypothetical protein
MACHIAAASGGPGARRVVPSMTKADRKSLENGIWMCRTHGTLIDLDEIRFTIPLLQQWRAAAERRAEIRQAQHQVEDRDDLFKHDVRITRENLGETNIGNVFIDTGIPVFWGSRISSTTRDFVFEVAQNALTHGSAKYFNLEITPKYIRLTDDGIPFDPRELPNTAAQRGGALSFQSLNTLLGDRLILSVRVMEHGNEYIIQYVRTQSDLTDATPCCVNFEHEITYDGEIKAGAEARIQGCRVVYIILPSFLSFSKAIDYMKWLSRSFAGRRLVLIGQDISDGVRDLMKSVPDSSFLALSADDNYYFFEDI